MGAIVLNASAAQAAAPLLRVYAHCTALAELGKAANGGVTLLVIRSRERTPISARLRLDPASISLTARPPRSPPREISLSDAPLSLAFDAALGGAQRAYVLAPSDDPSSSLTGRAGLLGTGITLNGELLAAGANGSVARLAPAPLDGASAVTVPPHAIGFYVFPTADHPACPWS